MTKPTISKLVIGVTLITAIFSITALIFDEPIVEIKNKWVDCWRVLVMAQAGLFIGFLVACSWKIIKLRVAPEDEFLHLLGAIASSVSLLAIMAICDMVHFLKSSFVTWRTPLGIVAFLIGDWALILLYHRLKNLTHDALKHGAVVRLTLIDTRSQSETNIPHIKVF